ncbi:hypothetical protein [Halpernia sp. GG3]
MFQFRNRYIAKLIPSTPGMNIAKALAKPEKLRPQDRVLAGK